MARTYATTFIFLTAIFLAASANARDEVNGCTSADLNTTGGRMCTKNGEINIIRGLTPVVAVCSGGKILCCADGRCVDVTNWRTLGGKNKFPFPVKRKIKLGSGVNGSGATSGGNVPSGGGSNVNNVAPSGEVKGSGSGCSGGVC